MAQSARHHGAGKVRHIAAARRQLHAQAENSARIVKADFPIGAEIVPLAGDDHIVVAVQPQLHGPLRFMGADCGYRSDDRGLAFLAAKPAAHAPHFGSDGGLRHAQHQSDMLLHFGWVLRRGPDMPLPTLLRDRHGDIRLQIEMILPANFKRAFQSVARRCQRALRIAENQMLRRADIALRRKGFVQ